MKTSRQLWIMFVSSVWVLIGLCGYEIVIHVLHANQIINAYPSGYNFKVLLAPFFLIGVELFLWFKMFRYPTHPARMFAGVIGLYIWLMVVFVNIVVSGLYDRDINNIVLLIYGYAGLGHIAYALFGKEGRY